MIVFDHFWPFLAFLSFKISQSMSHTLQKWANKMEMLFRDPLSHILLVITGGVVSQRTIQYFIQGAYIDFLPG